MKIHSITPLFFAGVCAVLFATGSDSLAKEVYRNASTQSDIGLKGFGPRIGFVDADGAYDETAEVGLVFDFGEFVPQLHWDGSISFWSTGRDFYYNNDRDNRYNWKLRDLALRSGVNYHFLVGEWVPYVGGGLGLHFYSWDYNNAPFYSNNSDTKVGFYIDGGISHRFSDGWTGKMQLQLDYADLDQTALLFDFIYHIQ